MTVIRPNNYRKRLQNIFLGFLVVVLVALVWWGIVMYGLLVDLRHDILVLQKKTQEYELTKVDLQDKLYKLVDLEYLSEKAEEFGLVKERNPDYIKIGEKPAPKQQTAISL